MIWPISPLKIVLTRSTLPRFLFSRTIPTHTTILAVSRNSTLSKTGPINWAGRARMWFDTVPHLRTSHTLNIQWDNWIWSPDMWRDEFLNYDYIGAVWLHHDPEVRQARGQRRLLASLYQVKALRRRPARPFPCDSDVDDALLCIKYRKDLEDAGFVWAPENIAHDFSFEGCDGSKPTRHFGFHATIQFSAHARQGAALFERMELVMRSPNLTKPNSYIMRAFVEKSCARARKS